MVRSNPEMLLRNMDIYHWRLRRWTYASDLAPTDRAWVPDLHND